MNNPTITEVRTYLVEGNGWSAAEFVEFRLANASLVQEDGSTTADRDWWTFLAMGHDVSPAVVDKRIWSATKVWFNGLDSTVQWSHLNEFERVGAREAFIEEYS